MQKNYYYKAHSEHAGFSDMVAKAREGESVDGGSVKEEAEKEKGGGKVEAREVAEGESDI